MSRKGSVRHNMIISEDGVGRVRVRVSKTWLYHIIISIPLFGSSSGWPWRVYQVGFKTTQSLCDIFMCLQGNVIGVFNVYTSLESDNDMKRTQTGNKAVRWGKKSIDGGRWKILWLWWCL